MIGKKNGQKVDPMQESYLEAFKVLLPLSKEEGEQFVKWADGLVVARAIHLYGEDFVRKAREVMDE